MWSRCPACRTGREPWNLWRRLTTNPAGSAIVNALGAIRQVVQGEPSGRRRCLVILPGTADQHGAPVQVQMPE